jgi:hypothetical protein
MRGGCIGHVFLTLALVGVVSFMPQPLYPQGKSSQYSIDRRLGGPQNCLGDEKKKFLPLLGLEPIASCYINCTIPGIEF